MASGRSPWYDEYRDCEPWQRRKVMALKAREVISGIRDWRDQNRGRSEVDWIGLEALIGIPIISSLPADTESLLRGLGFALDAKRGHWCLLEDSDRPQGVVPGAVWREAKAAEEKMDG